MFRLIVEYFYKQPDKTQFAKQNILVFSNTGHRFNTRCIDRVPKINRISVGISLCEVNKQRSVTSRVIFIA